MMRVLLVVEPPTRRAVSLTTMPPLGVLSVASALEARGVRCDVRDRNVDASPLKAQGYDAVGFSVNVTNVGSTLAAVRGLRAGQAPVRIVAGGPLCMTHADRLVLAGFDAAVIGEGEDTLYEYLTASDPATVAGLCLPAGEGTTRTPPRPWEEKLDRFPPPALDKVDLRRYRCSLRRALPVSSIVTSRGCPYQCIFCFHAAGHRFRARSPRHVVDEIEWQVRELGVRELCVDDDNFTLDIGRALAICRLIGERGLRVRLQLRAGVRVDRLTEDLCRSLKEAGTWLVTVSPETGSDDGLLRIKKGFTMAHVHQAMAWCRRAGLAVLACYMVGFPWEGRSEVAATIRTALQLGSDFIQVARVRPFPSTELYDMVDFGAEKDDGVIDTPGLFQGRVMHRTGISEDELRALLKSFHRRFYLRPRQVWRMARLVSPGCLLEMGRFALATRNV